mmetsp:Transcript_23671/g.55715  ORF Transcript_23671/g.55715 Transcript_23671/m.55715 type:complete len:231 (+) Transcript_23671:766-1458(+)
MSLPPPLLRFVVVVVVVAAAVLLGAAFLLHLGHALSIGNSRRPGRWSAGVRLLFIVAVVPEFPKDEHLFRHRLDDVHHALALVFQIGIDRGLDLGNARIVKDVVGGGFVAPVPGQVAGGRVPLEAGKVYVRGVANGVVVLVAANLAAVKANAGLEVVGGRRSERRALLLLGLLLFLLNVKEFPVQPGLFVDGKCRNLLRSHDMGGRRRGRCQERIDGGPTVVLLLFGPIQ